MASYGIDEVEVVNEAVSRCKMILSTKLMKLNASAKVLLKKNIHNIKK